MADIASIVQVERAVEIKHPVTSENFGVRIGLVALDDDRLEKLRRRITDRRMYLEARGKTFKAEEIEENKRELQFTAMTGWTWYNPTGKEGDAGYDPEAMPNFHGEDQPDFSLRIANQLLTEVKWFGDQIDDALGDEKSFFTTSKRI